MDYLISAAFSAFLLACAAGLLTWHVRAWRAHRRRNPEPEELNYFRRQFRRRMQTSAILAILAAALPVGHWIVRKGAELPGTAWPKWGLVFWGGVVLLLVWVGLLAVADIWATKFFFSRLRQRYWLEQTRLEAELRRIRGPGGNGKPPGKSRTQEPGDNDRGPRT